MDWTLVTPDIKAPLHPKHQQQQKSNNPKKITTHLKLEAAATPPVQSHHKFSFGKSPFNPQFLFSC